MGAHLIGPEYIDVEYCNYKGDFGINKRVEKLLDEKAYEKYNKIFITDISVSEEIAERIEAEAPESFQLLDHHKSALWLNKYNWAKVSAEYVALVDRLNQNRPNQQSSIAQ